MPLIDVHCGTCDAIAEVVRAVADWPRTPPCPSCGAATVQIHRPPGYDRTPPDPVVVYETPDGSFRFPGRMDGTSTAKYDRMGYRRIEARGWPEVRALEARMNRHEYSTLQRQYERRQEAQEAATKARRSNLNHTIQSMSEGGRRFARTVMARNDARDRRPRVGHPGIFVDVYSTDRSNR